MSHWSGGEKVSKRYILLGFVGALFSCVDGTPPAQDPIPMSRPKVDRTYLRDLQGRYIFYHGVNLSGSTKLPFSVDKQNIPTYVGKPFPEKDADVEFAKLRKMGFNVVRLLLMWEAVEPVQKGQYDQKYLTYIRNIVKKAGEHGIYVLMDFHQDMFSRHLQVKYNDRPQFGEPGSIEHTLLSLSRNMGYGDAVQGDGAPRWAVQACLYEKKMSSPYWGFPRILGGIGKDQNKITEIYNLFMKLLGQPTSGGMPSDPWVYAFFMGLPDATYGVDETTDMLPFTFWGIAHALSVDMARCYACLFAGDKVFPSLKMGSQNIKDYLQEAYAASWVQVAKQVKDLPNVIGYDIMNEPGGNFITLSAVAAVRQTGISSAAKDLLVGLLGKTDGEKLYETLITLKLLPPDNKDATLRKWGLDKVDLMAVLGLNNGFDETYMRPFYERVGRAILKEDPKALIWIESTSSIAMLTGGYGGLGGQWEVPMQHPVGPEFAGRVVYAPHWYPDIYPNIGFNVDPRTFTADQVRHRDYTHKIEEARGLAAYSLGNIPVVFGEFGTYYNFNNTLRFDSSANKMVLTNKSKQSGYQISSHILDNYYEGFEKLFQSNILWCYSPENTADKGDLWNREDFSVQGPADPTREFRSELAWSRPYARALAGKPISTHFYSDFHYFDPDKGVVPPRREFEVRYASQESNAPTEIFVPQVQYPDGFYVWVSDGHCHYDHATSILYHYPDRDEPGTEHWVRMRPPLPQQENVGWKYFFKGDRMAGGN